MDAFGTTALDNSYRPSTFDRVISGLGNSLSTLWDRRDDISTNIVTASQGAVQGAQNMLVNAPTHAKVPLYVATSFTLATTAVPVVEVVVTTVIANPLGTIGVTEFVNDVVNPSMPATTPVGMIYNMYDNKDPFIDFIQGFFE